MARYTISSFNAGLTADDAEETTLLTDWVAAMNSAETHRLQAFSKTEVKANEALERAHQLVEKLGYDPQQGRPAKARGRPRAQAIPQPLPPQGTVLKAATGAEYVVEGYVSQAASASLTVCIYYDRAAERMVARSIIHLFVGTLLTQEPFVTWPEDPRQLKPGQPVPLSKRRTISKRELQADRHYDPARRPETPEELNRRMPGILKKR